MVDVSHTHTHHFLLKIIDRGMIGLAGVGRYKILNLNADEETKFLVSHYVTFTIRKEDQKWTNFPKNWYSRVKQNFVSAQIQSMV